MRSSQGRRLCVCDNVGLCPHHGRDACVMGLWVCASSCAAGACVRSADMSSFGEFMLS
jgi:hypothetical protein